MKRTINFSQFCDAFRDYNRDNNFSYEGKQALFDYLEEYEESTGEELELDVIGICCDFSEYDSLAEAYKEWRFDYTYVEGEAREYFEENTTLIELDNGHVIVQEF